MSAVAHHPDPAAAPAPDPEALTSSFPRHDDLMSAEERRRWRRPVGWKAARDLGLIWLQIAAGIGLYLALPHPATLVVGFVLVAGGQHGLGLATHEFAHRLVLPDRPRLNDWIGEWLFAAPGGLPFKIYRHRHFAHHLLVSTAEDTKQIYRRDYTGGRMVLEVLRALAGIDYLEQVAGALRREGADQAKDKQPERRASLVSLGVVQLVIAAALGAVDPWLYLLLWLLPLVTLAMLFSKFRSSVEHLPYLAERTHGPESPYFGGTAGPFVRSVRASLAERLCFSKINFCYHAAHHLWPKVSYQALAILDARMAAAGAFDDPRLARGPSYLATLRDFVRGR